MTASERVERALASIEQHEDLNAFVQVQADAARRRAAELDAGAQRDGPLFGWPVALKDNIDQKGVVCAAGSAAYADRIPERDATVVSRLAAAGAVVVGRTNMHELADGVTSENEHFGPVHNPRRRGYHPGGSSGGSAAAVAAGCVPAALGTDTGGSVRIPASLCGVVGYKPTAGLVPTDGVMPLSTTLDHVGVLAQTAYDCARVAAVLAGVTLPGAGLPDTPLRIGVLDGFGLAPDPAVRDLFAQALETLEGMGHRLVEINQPLLADGLSILARIYAPEAARRHAARLRERPRDFSDQVRADLERGMRLDDASYEQALAERRALRAALDDAMQSLDFLATPTTPHPARPFGSPDPHTCLVYSCPFNLSGQPAVSVPMGEAEGLPAGLQLAAPRNQDTTLLDLAARFERERDK